MALLSSRRVEAQGLVIFANIGGGVVAPFSGGNGLLGGDYDVQLQFADGTNIGAPASILANGLFSSGTRTVPGVPAGESVDLQVAVFQSGLLVGTSDVFTVRLGGGTNPPSVLTGLTPVVVAGGFVDGIIRVDCGPGAANATVPSNQSSIFHLGEKRTLVSALYFDGGYALGDLDGDEDMDVLVASQKVGYRVFLQNDELSFERRDGELETLATSSVALGDVDSDGDLDAWFSASGSPESKEVPSEIWLNDGQGHFTRTDQDVGLNTSSVELLDLDGDGDLDALVSIESRIAIEGRILRIQSWLNDGGGRFTLTAEFEQQCVFSSISFRMADINGDALPDFVWLCSAELFWRLNQGAGVFGTPSGGLIATNILSPFQGGGMAIGDIDGDGDNDVFVPNGNFANSLWLNNGRGTFGLSRAELGAWSYGNPGMGDLDGDGDQEILLGEDGGTRIFWNLGDCDFQAGESLRISGAQLFDTDHDGDLDFVSRGNGGLVAHVNQSLVSVGSSNSEAIEIPDEQLRRVIATALGKPADASIFREEIGQLKRLDGSRRTWGRGAPSIEKLEGLEYAIGLTELDLAGALSPNAGEGLRELEGLVELRILRLEGSDLTAVSFPEALPSLEELYLSDNRLTELSVSSSLTVLRVLDVHSNRLISLSLPPSLSNLELLDAGDNLFETLVLPGSLLRLSQLELSNNRLQTITLPENAPKLGVLNLLDNRLSSVETLGVLSSLTTLTLSGDLSGSGLSFLQNLPGLKELTLTKSAFDFSDVEPLPSLEQLVLRESGLDAFELPAGYTSLRKLRVSGSITSVALPEDLANLTELHLGSSRLRELTLPKGLHALETLWVNSTPVSQIQFSSDARKLRALNLTSNSGLRELHIPNGVGADVEGDYSISLSDTRLERLVLPEYWPRPWLFRSALVDVSSFKVDRDKGVEFEVFGGYGSIVIERSYDLKTWERFKTLDNRSSPYSHDIADAPDEDASQVFYRMRHLGF